MTTRIKNSVEMVGLEIGQLRRFGESSLRRLISLETTRRSVRRDEDCNLNYADGRYENWSFGVGGKKS